MKKVFISILLGFSLTFLASINALAGSNLADGIYPSQNCGKAPRPPSSSSDLRYYESRVESYLKCMDDYMSNAASDAEQIERNTKAALKEVMKLEKYLKRPK
jgi:hypothetical protein